MGSLQVTVVEGGGAAWNRNQLRKILKKLLIEEQANGIPLASGYKISICLYIYDMLMLLLLLLLLKVLVVFLV